MVVCGLTSPVHCFLHLLSLYIIVISSLSFAQVGSFLPNLSNQWHNSALQGVVAVTSSSRVAVQNGQTRILSNEKGLEDRLRWQQE